MVVAQVVDELEWQAFKEALATGNYQKMQKIVASISIASAGAMERTPQSEGRERRRQGVPEG